MLTGDLTVTLQLGWPNCWLALPKQVNFGVYCTVAEPGEVSLGDEVALVTG